MFGMIDIGKGFALQPVRIERVFVRDLSDLTYNSGVGMGMADVVPDRLVNRVDWDPTWVNSLTSNTPAAIMRTAWVPTSTP